MANDKDPVFCAADIIKRAKLAKEFKTDSELAAFLGISRSTLSNWNARNSIDFPLLLGSLDDVDFDSELQKLLDGGFGNAPEEK